jgi:DNA-binding winged helix-turn-helix (wHTH) protein/predicted ATPase
MRGGQVTFGPFRLDVANERLWQGPRPISLRPKVFAVLKYLVEHPGQLVTKQELLDAVWPATFVGDAVLKDSVRQLREALEDDAGAPRYIETAHRRGYRFIGCVDGVSTETVTTPAAALVRPPTPAPGNVLGRDAELSRLRASLDQAFAGNRQVVFVTGEAGIGKTTVVNALVASADALGARIARGQCLEHYGAGEAYLPVLEGVSRLGRGSGGHALVETLRQHAPAWLRELPSLIPAAERESLQQQVLGATRERMLREMADAIEALAADAPLLLVLEDLHWSDYSTLDLIAYVARRRDPARLMVIGTYRPVDVILSEHPLKEIKRELQAHGLCQELPLEYLTESAIADLLALKFPGHDFPGRLARVIHRRTEGNALFVVNVVQHLRDERRLVEEDGRWQLRDGVERIESDVPENVRQLIERQLDRLTPGERRALEGASVAGMECSTVAIAAGLAEEIGWVEEQCEALVRRHRFLLPARLVSLPDGTVTPRYTFSHVLYRDVPYSLMPPTRRRQVHARIGERGEAIYGERVGEIAAELAMHFEQGQDATRAVRYLLLAAGNAMHRSAHHEAEALARRGLLALDGVPPAARPLDAELELRTILGVSMMATKGFAVAEVETVYTRALELCAPEGPSRRAFVFEWLLGLFHYFRGELEPAYAIAARLLGTAAGLHDDVILMEAHRASGVCLVDLGRFSEAVTHLDCVSGLYSADPSRRVASFAGQDPMVVSECFAARALWALGWPDRARDRVASGLSLARTLAQAPSLVIAMHFAAHLHQLRGEPALARAQADAVLALADEYGLVMWAALGRIHQGWADSAEGLNEQGIRQMQRGLTAYRATGGNLWRPHFLGLLAQALLTCGHVDDALAAIDEGLAIVLETSEHSVSAELHRIRGELMIARLAEPNTAGSRLPSRLDGPSRSLLAEAEACFQRALAIARRQEARSWELRAAASLGTLHYRRGHPAKARAVLDDVLAAFTEGHDTADAKAARALQRQIAT